MTETQIPWYVEKPMGYYRIASARNHTADEIVRIAQQHRQRTGQPVCFVHAALNNGSMHAYAKASNHKEIST